MLGTQQDLLGLYHYWGGGNEKIEPGSSLDVFTSFNFYIDKFLNSLNCSYFKIIQLECKTYFVTLLWCAFFSVNKPIQHSS